MMNKNLNSQSTLILVALERELPKSLIPNWNICYSGVGKVNAALSVAKAFQIYKPSVIVNFGTAGSLNKNLKGLVKINTFKQRDMDVRPLGFNEGETPYDELSTVKYNHNGCSCGTGDNFVTGKQNVITDIVDMESYPIAKFCVLNNIDFHCYKYISDNANHDAANDWELNMKNGADLFVQSVLNEN